MKLKPTWNGMFQGAFKHQTLIQGTDAVWYLRRPDIQLPVPPLPTIDIPNEVLPDLREVYGVDSAGNLYVIGTRERDEPAGDRRIICFPNVGYGEVDDFALLDHELGHPFHGHIALGPTGHIVAVSNLPSFLLFDATGQEVVSHRALGPFEAPATLAPFWLKGAGDVACGPDGFIVGGEPLDRIDYYAFDGRLLLTITDHDMDGRRFDLATEKVSKVAFDQAGRILASTSHRVFAWEADGRPAYVAAAPSAGGTAPMWDFHLWIGVDAENRVWSQFYKGKEVAYGVFECAADDQP